MSCRVSNPVLESRVCELGPQDRRKTCKVGCVEVVRKVVIIVKVVRAKESWKAGGSGAVQDVEHLIVVSMSANAVHFENAREVRGQAVRQQPMR